ncbi:MAG: hypothetical protein O7F74_04635 [Bacteroidetes bacterium]|nr:hypothetical protein [Bacteroidota bacterium]
MNNLLLIGLVMTTSIVLASYSNKKVKTDLEYEWYQTTVVESVVPGGFGRSRLIKTDSTGILEEVKLENFFSMTGINFGNIRYNDQIVTSHITDLVMEGWELYETTSGVYSGKGKNGIFITRYMYRRPIN